MENIIQSYNLKFWDIVQKYNLNEPNIFRKFIHSFEVARNCFALGCSKNLKQNDLYLCYLLGLFHDIGRFEQWTIFQTYDDNKSVDHGDLSEKIIGALNFDKLFNLKNNEIEILRQATKYHTKPCTSSNKRILLFNQILNNADAFSNIFSIANGTQQIYVSENGFSEEIVEAFKNRQLMRKYSPKTKLDRCLCLSACCYYVTEDYFRRQIINSNYFETIFETLSSCLNLKDKKLFKELLFDLKNEFIK